MYDLVVEEEMDDRFFIHMDQTSSTCANVPIVLMNQYIFLMCIYLISTSTSVVVNFILDGDENHRLLPSHQEDDHQLIVACN